MERPWIGHQSVPKTDRVLLEGPHSRRTELWLVLRALREFISGFRALHFVGPCITVFGSARYDESHEYYALGRAIGRGVAGLGFTATAATVACAVGTSHAILGWHTTGTDAAITWCPRGETGTVSV